MKIQNRVMNVRMGEANKNYLAYFLETTTWRTLRLIFIPVVDPNNAFAADRAPTVPYDSVVQVPVNREFSETFYR